MAAKIDRRLAPIALIGQGGAAMVRAPDDAAAPSAERVVMRRDGA
jgi:hypothetical protein